MKEDLQGKLIDYAKNGNEPLNETPPDNSTPTMSESLLHELIERNGIGNAPAVKKMVGKWHSTLIAIGTDETAEILMPESAWNALKNRWVQK